MARTYVPDPGRINFKMRKRKLLKIVHEQLLIAHGDSDKAGSVDDVNYYDGWVDALEWVEKLLTVRSKEKK